MDGAECGIINDACVSMRVCFDSLCFSSTQHRLADEEDANQLGNNNSSSLTGNVTTTMTTNTTPTMIEAGTIITSATVTTTGSPISSLPAMAPQSIHANPINNNNNNNNNNHNNNNGNSRLTGNSASFPESTNVQQPSASNHNVDGSRDFHELLRIKDERIVELENIVARRDAQIQELRSHLDKFLSVLPFKSPLTPTKPRPRKQRAQGISAEPPLQQLAPLVFYDKNDRCVLSLHFHAFISASLTSPNSPRTSIQQFLLVFSVHCINKITNNRASILKDVSLQFDFSPDNRLTFKLQFIYLTLELLTGVDIYPRRTSNYVPKLVFRTFRYLNRFCTN